MLPKGFQFAGVSCGIKTSGALDLAVIATDRPAVAAGVYTQNIVRAASIDWNERITPTDQFRGVVVNSGNANACTGSQGIRDNQVMAEELAQRLDARPEQCVVLSTGIIGHALPMDKIRQGIADAQNRLTDSEDSFQLAAGAILTTDKKTKMRHQVTENGIAVSGMAKGAGMIGPNMATMLAVIATDAEIGIELAQSLVRQAADRSFNRVSVEGHTSTNDALILICSGRSGVKLDNAPAIRQFEDTLNSVCVDLAKEIPADGEGASHLIIVEVRGAKNEQDADRIARTVASSALVKTAVTGADPNWGRIVSAAGYSGVSISAEKMKLRINQTEVFAAGQPLEFDSQVVSRSMSDQFEVKIELEVGTGPGNATHWTSDLTVEYVRFNSEYTT